jgi:nucleotide-binding universal stress UspA family protein
MYDTILVPTDGSDGAGAATRNAVTLARAFDATVHALSVVDDRVTDPEIAGLDGELMDFFEERARGSVEAVAASAEDAGIGCETAVERGVPHRRILEYADENGVDLVSMGTHGRTGLDRLLMGSVTERVVRKSDVPVLTTRADQPPSEYEDVLIPTDGSETASTAVEHGVAVAEATGARVHALAVVDVGSLAAASDTGTGISTVIESLRAGCERAVGSVREECEARGVEVTTAVTQGSPRAAILDYVDEESVDLVAMGTHGRSGVGRLILGSVTERVLRKSVAPVLTVR